MNDLEKKLKEQVMQEHAHTVALRRYFHKHPELSLHEENTAAKIEEELQSYGLSTKRIGKAGVYTEIHGELEGERTIVLRADIDALPIQEIRDVPYKSENTGVMHACGHDGHISALLSAAKILNENRNLFGGTVRITFQQAEEICQGAEMIIQAGCLEGADRTFGMHVAPELKTGTVSVMKGPNNASVDWFKITVNGVGAHVSTPEKGTDALYIASQIVVAVQAVATRCTNPMENVLIGIGKMQSGTAFNVVAEKAELEGTVRLFNPALRKTTEEKIRRIADNVAEMYGGTCDIEWVDFTPALINDPVSSRECEKVAKSLFSDENVITERTPSLQGDDFAQYINTVPGVYAFMGTGNPEKEDTCHPLHHTRFDIDEDALANMVLLHVCYAVEYLKGV